MEHADKTGENPIHIFNTSDARILAWAGAAHSRQVLGGYPKGSPLEIASGKCTVAEYLEAIKNIEQIHDDPKHHELYKYEILLAVAYNFFENLNAFKQIPNVVSEFENLEREIIGCKKGLSRHDGWLQIGLERQDIVDMVAKAAIENMIDNCDYNDLIAEFEGLVKLIDPVETNVNAWAFRQGLYDLDWNRIDLYKAMSGACLKVARSLLSKDEKDRVIVDKVVQLSEHYDQLARDVVYSRANTLSGLTPQSPLPI